MKLLKAKPIDLLLLIVLERFARLSGPYVVWNDPISGWLRLITLTLRARYVRLSAAKPQNISLCSCSFFLCRRPRVLPYFSFGDFFHTLRDLNRSACKAGSRCVALRCFHRREAVWRCRCQLSANVLVFAMFRMRQRLLAMYVSASLLLLISFPIVASLIS